MPEPSGPTFFVSRKGTAVIYVDFSEKFRELVRSSVSEPALRRARAFTISGHSFAVNTLVRWHRAGEDVGALLPRLSTYLGHLTPGYTCWYLSAARSCWCWLRLASRE